MRDNPDTISRYMRSGHLMSRADLGVGEGAYDSIQWAFEVHLKAPDTGEYHTAILYGNEDAPEAIEFFKSANPLIQDNPDFTWTAPEE